MEILYRVGDQTFKDKETAEEFERKYKAQLVTKAIQYKTFYLPLAFKHYGKTLEALKTAKANFRMKNYTSVTNLCKSYKEWFEKKRIMQERTAEYRNIKAIINQLSTAKKKQKNKKTESKK